MMNKRLMFSSVFLLTLALIVLKGQESINASGGNAFGSGGSESYSVGQVFYQTQLVLNTSITQGVQQPYEISVASNFEVQKSTEPNFNIYPSPATDIITLEIKDFDHISIFYRLYDVTGKLLIRDSITTNLTSIKFRNLLPGTYFLKIMQFDKELKVFKIIKY